MKSPPDQYLYFLKSIAQSVHSLPRSQGSDRRRDIDLLCVINILAQTVSDALYINSIEAKVVLTYIIFALHIKDFKTHVQNVFIIIA